VDAAGRAAPDGGGGYVLTGGKTWITNGARAEGVLGDAFLVYASMGAEKGAGLSLFLVERGMPGFSLGGRIKDKCGMRASNTAELVLEGVRVPAANLVGAAGGAVLSMMRNLEVERLGLAAMSLGIARRCIEVMNGYAAQRLAFGAPINRFGQVQRMIADSYAEYAAC
jgi:isovaleryl-CoA dehydrogenase